MYIALKENIVGVVEDGVIVETYDNSESVIDVYEKSADPIESEYIGEKASSEELTRLNCNSERCLLDRNVGQEDTVDHKTEVGDIELLAYI